MNINLRIAIIALSTLSSLSMAAPVATVNGVVISDTRLDASVKAATSQGQKNSPELRAYLKEQLIREELLAQEAQRKGLDKTPAFTAKIQSIRAQLLADELYASLGKQFAVSEAEIKAQYDKTNSNLGGKELNISQIVLKTEAEANAAISKLQAGGDFAKEAKAQSIDPNTKNKGGNAGWLPVGAFPPNVSQDLQALGKNSLYSKAISNGNAWYVIKVNNSRAMKKPTLKEVRKQIEAGLRQQKVEKYMNDLRAKAKIQ